jgi:hypothetical protein
MAYVDPNTIHNPTTGSVAPAAWGDVVRDDLEFLIDPPVCSLSGAATSAANLTIVTLTCNTEIFDNDAMHSTVTNPTRITAQTAGRYDITAVVRYDFTAGGGGRLLQFFHNATTQYNVAQVASTTVASRDTIISGGRKIVMAAGDFVEVRARQDSGGTINVTVDEFAATFLTR